VREKERKSDREEEKFVELTFGTPQQPIRWEIEHVVHEIYNEIDQCRFRYETKDRD